MSLRSPTSTDLPKWTTSHLSDFLSSNNFQTLSSICNTNCLCGYDLFFLSEETLKEEYGVPFHERQQCLKIFNEIIHDYLKLTLIYNNTDVVEISLDNNHSIQLSNLMSYISSIFKLDLKEIIIKDSSNTEIISPTVRIVNMMILFPEKYKQIHICHANAIYYEKFKIRNTNKDTHKDSKHHIKDNASNHHSSNVYIPPGISNHKSTYNPKYSTMQIGEENNGGNMEYMSEKSNNINMNIMSNDKDENNREIKVNEKYKNDISQSQPIDQTNKASFSKNAYSQRLELNNRQSTPNRGNSTGHSLNIPNNKSESYNCFSNNAGEKTKKKTSIQTNVGYSDNKFNKYHTHNNVTEQYMSKPSTFIHDDLLRKDDIDIGSPSTSIQQNTFHQHAPKDGYKQNSNSLAVDVRYKSEKRIYRQRPNNPNPANSISINGITSNNKDSNEMMFNTGSNYHKLSSNNNKLLMSSGENEEMKFKPSYQLGNNTCNIYKDNVETLLSSIDTNINNNGKGNVNDDSNYQENNNYGKRPQQYNSNNAMSKGGRQIPQPHRVFNEDFMDEDYNNNYIK